MMRVGELTKGQHVLKAENIHVAHSKDRVLITLYTSKTHGAESGPQKIRISSAQHVSRHRSNFFCPVQLVIQFMNMRGHFKKYGEQFFVFSDRSPVLPIHFRSTLRNFT